MKFQVGQRVSYRSLVSDHVYTGKILKSMKDGFYAINDGTGLSPRTVHHSRLNLPAPPTRAGSDVA